MFQKLVATLKSLTRTPTPVDPQRFNDPIALRTQWTPAARGGANFCTRKLVEAGPGRMEFRATLGMKLFALFFMGMGLAAVAAGISCFVSLRASGEAFAGLLPVGIGSIFVLVGGGMFSATALPVVFDRQSSLFYKGKGRAPGASGAPPRDFIELHRIHALQLISEHVSGSKSSYYSYELNLVLDDASRVNVVDHGGLERIRQDAQALSLFLGKPVWDAI